MSLTKDVLTLDNLLHAGGGLVMAVLVLWKLWLIPIVWVAWGLLREQSYSAGKSKARGEKPSWVDWINMHKFLEGVAWGLGAGLAYVVWKLVNV